MGKSARRPGVEWPSQSVPCASSRLASSANCYSVIDIFLRVAEFIHSEDCLFRPRCVCVELSGRRSQSDALVALAEALEMELRSLSDVARGLKNWSAQPELLEYIPLYLQTLLKAVPSPAYTPCFMPRLDADVSGVACWFLMVLTIPFLALWRVRSSQNCSLPKSYGCCAPLANLSNWKENECSR